MKRIYKGLKNIFLIVGGALLGVWLVIIEEFIKSNILTSAAIVVTMLFLGLGLLDLIPPLYYKIRKWISYKWEIVGIYAPYEIIKGQNSSWVGINKQTMKSLLDSQKIKYTILTKEKSLKENRIILNPYGGVYPENDLSSLESLDKIFMFVQEGGIYINIADIPFYYAFDKNLNRRIDTTPFAGDFLLARSFLDTKLTQKLHTLVIRKDDGFPGHKEYKRIIQLFDTKNSLVEFIPGDGYYFSPVLIIPYGKGYFVFSTFQINMSNANDNILRVLNRALLLLK